MLGSHADPTGVSSGPWRQAAAIAGATWRAAWRQAVVPVELAMLVVEAIIAAVAAIGSPTPAAAAVQVLAVSLALVPFAVVLPVGQLVGRVEDEPHVWSRPVTAAVYVGGRALGLVLVDVALAAAVVAVASLALALFAHLALGPSLAWNAALTAAYALPSAVLLVGVCLAWRAAVPSAAAYYAGAIALALASAFYSYKLTTAVAAVWPSAALWAPFPALLTLGLAVPPALVAAPWLPLWLVANRVLFLCGGIGGMALGAALLGRRARAFGRRRRPRAASAIGATAVALAAAGAAGVLNAGGGAWLLPQARPATVTAALRRAPLGLRGSATLRLEVDAASGSMSGSAAFSLTGSRVRTWLFALNAGLTPRAVRVDGRPVRASAVAGVVAGTGARLWWVPAAAGGDGRLTLAFAGRLLPEVSFVPLAPLGPYGPAAVPEAGRAGAGRLFLAPGGTWWPRPLTRAGIAAISVVRAVLDVANLVPGVRVTTGGWRAGTGVWRNADADALAVFAAPARVEGVDGVRLVVGPDAPPSAAYAAYARALARLAPDLPGTTPGGPRPTIVAMPVTGAPVAVGDVLLAVGLHPYCVPGDPVAAGCVARAPGAADAMLAIARAAWLTVFGDAPTVLDRWAVVAPPPAPALLAQATVWRAGCRSAVCAPARLAPALRAAARTLDRAAIAAPPTAWRRFARLAATPPASGIGAGSDAAAAAVLAAAREAGL